MTADVAHPDSLSAATRLFILFLSSCPTKAILTNLKLAMAVTGLGNLVELEVRSGGYLVRVKNPSLPLVTVGNALAFYEFITGKQSSSYREITDDGDLNVELSPA
jgi:hypothetical protein